MSFSVKTAPKRHFLVKIGENVPDIYENISLFHDPRTAGYPHPQHTNPLDNYGYLPPNMPPTRAIGTPFQSPHRHSLHTTYQRTQQPQLHRQTRISHDHLPYSSSPRSANNVIGHGPSSNSSSNAAVAYYAHYGSQDSGQLGGSGQRLDRSSGGIDGCGVVSRAPIGLPKLPANMFDVLPHSNPGVGYIPDWLRIYITLPEFVKSIAEEAVNSQYSMTKFLTWYSTKFFDKKICDQ